MRYIHLPNETSMYMVKDRLSILVQAIRLPTDPPHPSIPSIQGSATNNFSFGCGI